MACMTHLFRTIPTHPIKPPPQHPQVIIFLLYSFWVPQIVLNATKGIRHPLNRTYVVGMSAARLVIPLYLYGCPENFIHLLFSDYKPDYRVRICLDWDVEVDG